MTAGAFGLVVGSPAVMEAEIAHLRAVDAGDEVSVRVLSATNGVHAAMRGEFSDHGLRRPGRPSSGVPGVADRLAGTWSARTSSPRTAGRSTGSARRRYPEGVRHVSTHDNTPWIKATRQRRGTELRRAATARRDDRGPGHQGRRHWPGAAVHPRRVRSLAGRRGQGRVRRPALTNVGPCTPRLAARTGRSRFSLPPPPGRCHGGDLSDRAISAVLATVASRSSPMLAVIDPAATPVSGRPRQRHRRIDHAELAGSTRAAGALRLGLGRSEIVMTACALALVVGPQLLLIGYQL